ncbi:MAG: hypothetical protein F6K26_27930 [Moorea sp. SIO2I5]|nr:hypothetical protein [Moorena sp. SIO2I5]
MGTHDYHQERWYEPRKTRPSTALVSQGLGFNAKEASQGRRVLVVIMGDQDTANRAVGRNPIQRVRCNSGGQFVSITVEPVPNG